MVFTYKRPTDTCGEGNGSALQYDDKRYWQSFPVLYSLDVIGEYNFTKNTPEEVHDAMRNCFEYVNDILGFEFFRYTDDISKAHIKCSWAPLDGTTLGRCSTNRSRSTGRINRGTLLMDSSNRKWFINPKQSCGGTGTYFDIQNTFTHEIGHAIGLAHNFGDSKATMYNKAGRGSTYRRTFSKGEVDLLRKMYAKWVDSKPPTPTPEPTPIPTPEPGTTDCNTTIYKSTGQKWTPKFNGGQEITYDSDGTKAISYRWDANNVTSPSLEATYWCVWPTDSGRGDQLELKFWGPTHSDGNCCWCMVNVHGDGRTGFGHEGPHPSTSNFTVQGTNVGNFKGKLVGIKGVIWPISGGAHVEGYMNTTGKWVKFGEYNGPCGKNTKSTTPVASQQIQFRVDNIQPDMKCAVIAAITPPTQPIPEPGKPLEGFVKNEGEGWGANKDPNTWQEPINMRDFPHLFKIVDDKGINVATHFTTKERAQEYIDYYKHLSTRFVQ